MKKSKALKNRIIIGFILSLLPIICVLLRTLPFGESISSVWIGASEWNDELFYYKQVEGMVANGIPQGYFGFNESHGLYLSFAAWSPALLLPWVLYGLIFGWNPLSPIICNLIFLTVSLFLFGFFSKIDYKKMGLISALFLLFTPFSRYILSTMPDIIVISLLLIVMGLATGFDRYNDKYGKIVWMFILLFLLTLMRPYLILFMIIPTVFLIWKTKHGYYIAPLAILISLISYMIVNKAFGAPYFTDLFRTDFIKAFLSYGIPYGIRYTLYVLYDYGIRCLGMMKEALISGLAAGSYFVSLCLFTGIFFVDFVVQCAKKEKGKRTFTFLMFLINFGMFMAVLLMYKLTEGSKHLITFIAIDIFVLIAISKFRKTYTVIVGLIFIWLFIIKGTSKYDYHVPYTDEIRPSIEQLSDDLNKNMNLKKGLSWDNTVIWVFYDENLETGKSEMVPWQQLYALPEGFGINLCEDTYVLENIDWLKPRYIVTIPEGNVALSVTTKGATKVGGNDYVSVFDLSTMK